MALSPQSASLQSVPGYAPRAAATVAAFAPNIPTLEGLPQVPTLANDAASPNYVSRNLLANQLGQLGGQQNASLTQIQAGAKQALAGYGGYGFQTDDPNTPQREDLLLNYDPNKAMGQRQLDSLHGATNQANAAGMRESSFANQNIASAVQRTSLEAQQIANQYAASINQTVTSYANQASQIAGQWTSLYGQDAAWQINNPPPPPPGHDLQAAQDYAQQQIDALPWNQPVNAQTPKAQAMTYADFLKGRKSTPALAHEWDLKFNWSRRFG